MKTEKAKSTVTPRAIFSPESGGKQNTRTVKVLIIMQGNTMLYLKQIEYWNYWVYDDILFMSLKTHLYFAPEFNISMTYM